MRERPIGATTTLVAVLGSPVRHSLSPVIHNAAFAETGLDWAMAAFEVAERDAAGAAEGIRALGLAGASVTMPLKRAMAAHVDELDEVASRLGALNCIQRSSSGRLLGSSTDGPGLLAALAEAGVEVAGRRVLVVGAGGAARAAVLALASAGASAVVVVARRSGQAAEAAALGGSISRSGVPEEAREADLVVNATPVGMDRVGGQEGGPAFPIDPSLLGAGQTVLDMVYEPVRTPWLDAAERRGASALDGVGMLVHQAALAFERWTGAPAPLGVMHQAARRALWSRQGAARH